LIAGPLLDRYSKKIFICAGLFIAGWLLIGQGMADKPETLLWLRLIFGFTMAFVTPTCLALLGQLARNPDEQGVFMVKKGMALTAASIVSPAIGGLLAAKFGYGEAFFIFGGVMMTASIVGLWNLPTKKSLKAMGKQPQGEKVSAFRIMLTTHTMYPAYVCGFATTFASGTIMYEIPLLLQEKQQAPTVSGILFSIMGLGSLVMLSQFWLNRTSPVIRCCVALLVLGLTMYGMALFAPASLYIPVFIIGACFGILYPAMTTMLAQSAPPAIYGTAFSLYAAALSVGSIAGPIVAGAISHGHETFFISFLVAMVGSLITGWLFTVTHTNPRFVAR
jgi:MFS family permease